MNKIPLIIEREYLSRVKKKSFIIMSILGPLLIAALYLIPILLATMDSTEVRKIAVIDTTGELKEALKNSETIIYEFWNNTTVDSAKVKFPDTEHYALLYRENSEKYSEKGVVLLSDKQASIDVKNAVGGAIERNIEQYKMKQLQITQSALDSIQTHVQVETRKLSEEGQEETSSTEIAMGISFMAALFIYMIVFLYGAQVMRGVIEEKNNRIVEVIISSVKPFQLMMGKVLGVALVVLTQLAIWGVLTSILIAIAGPLVALIAPNADDALLAQQAANGIDPEAIKSLQSKNVVDNFFGMLLTLNLPLLLFAFVFYLITGYLAYAALFAAVGAAVDNETDSQQFMLPVSSPMILSFVFAMYIIREPDGPLAFWMSIIPFTSPISMMVRIPFGVPVWELVLSMVLMVAAFLGTTWIAAKIYRTGILMYGKKPTYKELWKWLRHSS